MSGSGRVAVVTDSTAYLPDGLAGRYDVAVVPLRVVIDHRSGAEGRDVHPAEVAELLGGPGHRRHRITTSRPSPQDFTVAYQAAARAGARALVSVHLSGALSGTVESARQAAGSAPVPVRVVDSRTTAMGLGFAVLAAAELAAGERSLDEVATAAELAAGRTTTLFYVDTLEYLRRGGRIGQASALLGSALAMKPLLHMAGGGIEALEKVRTASRAIGRLAELAVDAAGTGPVDIAVHHLGSPDRADALAATLRGRLPALHALYVGEVGAVIGAHVGPGVLAAVVSRR
ncbi:MAG TPA: DegV family protein [Mycobacteriales bacterium]|nr:DegV family protein [Mycobacteriales bacterium]